MHESDPQEEEIFTRDVNLLDMTNNSIMEGRLILTRYRLVFQPYERIKEQVPLPSNPARSTFTEKFVMKKLPKYRAQFFNVPIHLILSVKTQLDK